MSLLPAHIQRKLVERAKCLLIASNRNRLFRFAGMRIYDLMRWVIQARFASVPGVRAVYLCHGLATGECYPGLSDFDITVVFDSPDPPAFYPVLRRRWGSLKRYFPLNDLSILRVNEFEEWQNIGGGWDPLEEIRHWRLIAGQELRQPDFGAADEAVDLDRMAWALGHFQNLLLVAIKEEYKSPQMAIVARRQLYKSFWNTVHALDPKYMAIRNRKERVEKWILDRGRPGPVAGLEAMQDCRFVAGPVTTLRFEVAALAYRLLDESLQDNPILARRLYRPESSGEPAPISNQLRVEERARAIADGIREVLGDKVLSIILNATGTARGYSLYIVLRDGLSAAEIASVLRDIRAIHRVFDDSWFNEHLPAGIPIVCSRAMFTARLQGGRSSLHYFEKFRCVIFGPDLYQQATTASRPEHLNEISVSRQVDWRRERLLYSLNLHQIYLGRLKAALHDYLSFYLPRMIIQGQSKGVPATAEEAVDQFARLIGGEPGEMPRRMLRQFSGRDLDYLLKNMDPSAFADSWPVLRQGLYGEPRPS